MQARNYWCVRAGKGAFLADDFYKNNYIAVGWNDLGDLSAYVNSGLDGFDKGLCKNIIKFYTKSDKKVSAGYVIGVLYNFCVEMKKGDIVLLPMPAQSKEFCIGEITGDYFYKYVSKPKDGSEPRYFVNRRSVEWLRKVNKADISEGLRFCLHNRRTLWDCSQYKQEIDAILNNKSSEYKNKYISDTDISSIKNSASFALEVLLEDSLIKNWDKTELGRNYKIFRDENDDMGRQYQIKAGRIDILAKSKDGKEILVVELKRGKAGDIVVGQVMRYIGFIEENRAEKGQEVRGCIIALKPDEKLRYALRASRGRIDFYVYARNFTPGEPNLTLHMPYKA